MAPAGTGRGRRILLLASQAFALGLTTAWIVIPSTTIFLERYGSGLLPVTYIGAAIAGAIANAAFRVALRRRPLVAVVTRVLTGLAIALAGCWLLLWTGADWVSFGLLVLVPIVVPVGFMFVVGQAGMLLDVREMKAAYGRVIAGFATGFVVGGLGGPVMLAVLGSTEHLLAAAAVVAAVFLALVVQTRRTFAAALSVVDTPEADAAPPTLRTLMRHRYVALIIAFQMLSAMESQWLDYLVFDRAATRYEDSRELADFIGRFTAIAYGADILFLLAVAGLLLRRFGLRYGLTANSIGVLALVGAVVVSTTLVGAGAGAGAGTTVVFVLIVAARVTDLTLSDGTSRTSLGAAYQAVPGQIRLAAQAATEGLAVPVAIGLSGVVLIVLRATVGTAGLALPVLTSLVVATWAVVSLLVYRGYRSNLLANLRHRVLDPAELIDDAMHSTVVIDRLVHSDDERDVRLGLDTLAVVEHPELHARLHRLTADERPTVRADVLARLVRLDAPAAAAVARSTLGDPSPLVRAACIHALVTAGDPADLRHIEPLAGDQSTEVRVAVAAAMDRIGDLAARGRLGADIQRLSSSPTVDQRVLAAKMLAVCEPGPSLDRAVLRSLLTDDDAEVANAAMAAIRWSHDIELIDLVFAHLRHRPTAGAAVEALARGDERVLGAIDQRLGDPGFGRRPQELLARVCRTMGTPEAAAVLRRHVLHTDREVGLAIMTALAAAPVAPVAPLAPAVPVAPVASVAPAPPAASLGPATTATTATAGPEPWAAVVALDVEHAAHVLRTLVALDGDASTAQLCAALRDELHLERRRVLAGLSIRHGTEGLRRVADQFAQPDPRLRGLALEWLDVTLTGTDRAVVALLETGVSDRDRSRTLARWFPLEPLTATEALHDLIEDRDDRWRRPWITACALHVAATTRPAGATATATNAATTAATPGTSATASPGTTGNTSGDDEEIIAETLAAIRARGLVRPSA